MIPPWEMVGQWRRWHEVPCLQGDTVLSGYRSLLRRFEEVVAKLVPRGQPLKIRGLFYIACRRPWGAVLRFPADGRKRKLFLPSSGKRTGTPCRKLDTGRGRLELELGVRGLDAGGSRRGDPPAFGGIESLLPSH